LPQEPVWFSFIAAVYVGAVPLIGDRGPTNRGIVLFPTLVNDETHVAQIDAARHNAACEPYKAD